LPSNFFLLLLQNKEKSADFSALFLMILLNYSNPSNRSSSTSVVNSGPICSTVKPAIARSINPSTSISFSYSITFSKLGFVFGRGGVNIVQQSSYGRIDNSYVSISCAI